VSPSVANAPVSYGVFELTVGSDRYLAPAERVLEEVAAAGYGGIDLGPVGYLADTATISQRLARHGLSLSGAYIELAFHDPPRLEAAMPSLDRLLDTLDAAQPTASGPPARPTLAAATSPTHHARPGQAQADPSIGLDNAGWQAFGRGLELVVRRCRERGHEPTFHHHAATYVEAPREIERLLALSDVGLCLDTGHLLVAGGDPLAALSRWADRINHVHLKEAAMSVMAEIVAAGASADQIWARSVFGPLGTGDLGLEGILRGLAAIGYQGWVVVEQDVLTDNWARFQEAVVDQRANRARLAELGW